MEEKDIVMKGVPLTPEEEIQARKIMIAELYNEIGFIYEGYHELKVLTDSVLKKMQGQESIKYEDMQGEIRLLKKFAPAEWFYKKSEAYKENAKHLAEACGHTLQGLIETDEEVYEAEPINGSGEDI